MLQVVDKQVTEIHGERIVRMKDTEVSQAGIDGCVLS
jgi:hypothetical protein